MTHKIDGGLPVTPLLRSTVAATRTGSTSNEPTQSIPSMDSLRLTGDATSLLTLQREIASSPSFDEGKVAAVRKSLEDGSYQINAGRIAEAMLDLDRLMVG